MKQTSLAFCALLISFLFSITACKNKRSDEKIREDINTKMASMSMASGVTATVADGVVSLSGECTGEHCADTIVHTVEKVDGVERVDNKVSEVPDKTDLTLRTTVQTIISKYPGVQADVASGVIVLRGSIKREQLQPLMNELGMLQAKKLDNQLAIE